MTLAAQIVADASAVFQDTTDFAESSVVLYGLDGGDRTISAQVIRGGGIARRGPARELREWECDVYVVNDATSGCTYREIKALEAEGKRLKLRLPEDPARDRWQLQQIVRSDPGMLVLRFAHNRRLRTGPGAVAREF